jgi:hypothetical protein
MRKVIIGFDKDGLKINQKKFNPLKMSVNGYGVDFDDTTKEVNPFDLIKELSAVKDMEDTRSKSDKISILESMVNK